MPVMVQVADAANNASYSDLAAVFELKMSRRSQSQPGVLTLKCGADHKLDSAALKRFNPHQRLRVIEGSAGVPSTQTGRKYFEGRIDTAELNEDIQYGRVWQISARDWLACLADNYIDRGQWLSVTSFARGTSHSSGDPWVANYVGDYTNGQLAIPAGEYRANIITDLAMNVLHDAGIGIKQVDTAQSPNSKPIEWNADNNAMICILDAIRQLASADPWSNVGSGGSQVDGKDLAKDGFPENTGFGGEFQIVMNKLDDDPQNAEYFERGGINANVRLTYGTEIFDPNTTQYIVEYQFAKQGTDIFSRTRVVGKGEGQYSVNVGPNGDGGESTSEGTGVMVPAMETTWDPAGGLFHIRRENPNPRQQSLVGESGYEDSGTEVEAIRARALRDAAYASLVSGGSGGLANFRGGANQGTVTIAGPPNDPSGIAVIRPGTLTAITIPQEGFDAVHDQAGSVFVIQDWSYDFPVDKTTLTLARLGFADLGTQLLSQLNRSQDSATAHNDYFDSGWEVSDQGGTVTIRHSLGVKPSKIQVEASLWDGTARDQNTAPLPTLQTTVTVPPTGWDAAQGQNHGFFVSTSDAQKVTIKFAHWLAYSDGAGKWLTHDDPNTLIRVRVLP